MIGRQLDQASSDAQRVICLLGCDVSSCEPRHGADDGKERCGREKEAAVDHDGFHITSSPRPAPQLVSKPSALVFPTRFLESAKKDRRHHGKN